MARPSSAKPVVIDARPRGAAGPFAEATVLGRTMLDHLLDTAESLGEASPAIYADEREQVSLTTLLKRRRNQSHQRLSFGPPPEASTVLRTDRLYDASKLRSTLRKGRSPESAVVWRLDTPHALAGAGDELLRRRTYQPLGRFWAIQPARALARILTPTRVRPNALTLASAVLMLISAASIAWGNSRLIQNAIPAALMALALVLDTADGHLARLQGTASNYGRWLDSNLDELGDITLHVAVAWSAYQTTSWVGWLLIALIYTAGKYLFFVGTTTWQESNGLEAEANPAMISARSARGLAHWLGHADLRWHSWIILAGLGRLDVELVAFAIYFPARTLAGAWRKRGRHEQA